MKPSNRSCTAIFLAGIICTIAVGGTFSPRIGFMVAAFWFLLIGILGYEKEAK